MDVSRLPRHATQTIDYLAFISRGYGGKLQTRAIQRFKAALVKSPAKWTPDSVSLQEFEQRCLDVGITEADAGELTVLLRRLQSGDRMRVTSRFDRAAPIEVSDDWSPPDREADDPDSG